ncbi:hypothetical protein LWP59_38035 [Amycolatopsis acidiphila]|uniref:Carboxypeptidase regulatory-like domain-containing protein n=1 Tax=Amycolatopsis acidiphila TaxID=715473 RepID=A0A558ABS1_9PSEU|nr:hypothetical protein [Amycolatopsis acidiphila]TVT21718.1 hypothetical protein FNH06_16320 [Amycolatopsis acidiphila]UIJ59742.1 hypothetical protein LWP59_38035 [Amycolatopsis acidiphila]GHG98589.1 hypothetical protein GCM10017788_78800 [Amycolatopsis acidiphila]
MDTVTPTTTAPTPYPASAPLASPTVLPDFNRSRQGEVLVAGQIITAEGTPITDAMLTLHGYQVRADREGTFEILTKNPGGSHPAIEIRVTAPGYRPHTVRITLDRPDQTCARAPARAESSIVPTQLGDGTLVVQHHVVLNPTSCGD